MFVHEPGLTTCLLAPRKNFMNSAQHLLLRCRAASGPHLDLWAGWTPTKHSTTRATDNMAMLNADSSSLSICHVHDAEVHLFIWKQ